jgi:small subunit ribosomal protein S1
MAPDNDDRQFDDETTESRPETDEMANWMELAAPKEVKRGDIVTGTVAGTSEEGVHVDLGAKLEGLISRTEFASESDYPALDAQVEVAVLRIDEEAGVIRVSKRRADFDRVWVQLEELAKAGGVVEGMVTERVKGGLRVDVGVPGFVPASQVETRDVRALERYVGRSLRLRVMEADRPQTPPLRLSAAPGQ